MAALLQFASACGAPPVADTVARLNRVVRNVLNGQAATRPTLVSRWLQDPDGRLS